MQSQNLANFFIWVTVVWLLIMLINRLFSLTGRYGILVGPFYLMWRTTRINRLFDNIASRKKRAWLVFFDIGIALGIGQMVFAYYWLIKNLFAFLSRAEEAVPVYPVIPGLTIGVESLKYFIPAILIIFITHEFAHGIAARLMGVNIKSVGILAVFVLLGAFVEPNEEELDKLKVKPKLRIFSAGSMANLITAMLFITLIGILFFQTPSGVMVRSTLEGYPAHGQIPPYSVIIRLDNRSIASIKDLAEYMDRTKPYTTVVVEFIDPQGEIRNVILKLAPNPSRPNRGFLGVEITDYIPSRMHLPPKLTIEIFSAFSWIQMLCISVAVLNMLPIYPFDGGKIIFTLIDSYVKGEWSKKLLKVLFVGSAVILLVSNTALTLMKYPILPI